MTFVGRLGVIAGFGLLARFAYALGTMADRSVSGDGLQFHLLALGLAEGDGYVQPEIVSGGEIPTADKPPLYPLVLAIPSALGLDGVDEHRFFSCLMGGALVVLVGLLARRVAGERVAIVAALIAAFHPALVVLDGSLRSESLYAPLVALALLAAYRLADEPSLARAAQLGAAIGLAALTRSEALAFAVLLLVPALVPAPSRLRVQLATTCLVVCTLILSPWVIRNWVAFDEPTLSTNSGSLLAGANCEDAYFGGAIGSWPCFPVVPRTWGTDEVDISERLRDRGLDYAGEHAGRLPAVMGVRVLRSFDAWDPVDASRLEADFGDRDLTMQRAGMIAFYLLVPFAVAGAVLLRRRRRWLALLVAPLVLVIMVSVTGYGTTRFRVPGDVAMTVLAAVAIARVRAPR